MGCVILLIVVIMMQVVCCEKKKAGKKKKKGDEARPFCTGCLYVWEELLKINTDTVVNTKKVIELGFFFSNFPHKRAESLNK